MTERPHRLLVVDDDPELRSLLQRFLTEHGFAVRAVDSGKAMDIALQREPADVIVLDLMMPGEDGLSLTRRLRGQGVAVPIVMLTAMGEDTDRIVGLEMGADDYVPKPFNPRELLARIKAVLRRVGDHDAPVGETALAAPRDAAHRDILRFADWTLDAGRRQLRSPDGVLVEITGGEYDLLLAFLLNAQRVLNRDQLLDLTRGRVAGPMDRTIDVQVGRLRRKLEVDPKNPELIKTVRGGGYVLTTEVYHQ